MVVASVSLKTIFWFFLPCPKTALISSCRLYVIASSIPRSVPGHCFVNRDRSRRALFFLRLVSLRFLVLFAYMEQPPALVIGRQAGLSSVHRFYWRCPPYLAVCPIGPIPPRCLTYYSAFSKRKT